jgi:hypothetical protein
MSVGDIFRRTVATVLRSDIAPAAERLRQLEAEIEELHASYARAVDAGDAAEAERLLAELSSARMAATTLRDVCRREEGRALEVERLREQAAHAALVEVQRQDGERATALADEVQTHLRALLTTTRELRQVTEHMSARVDQRHRADLRLHRLVLRNWLAEAGIIPGMPLFAREASSLPALIADQVALLQRGLEEDAT